MSKSKLVKCFDCDHGVSHSALYCPQCGCNLRVPSREGLGKAFEMLFFIFNLFMLLIAVLAASVIGNVASFTELVYGGVFTTGVLTLWANGSLILGLLVLVFPKY